MSLPGYIVAYPDEKLKEKNFKTREFHLNTLKSQAHYLLTLCEQLRFVYDDVAQLPDGELKDSMTEKLVDALIMAKRMNGRLVDYKKTVGKYSGAHGAHLIHLTDTKKRKRLRNER
jgi:hypothetical protein